MRVSECLAQRSGGEADKVPQAESPAAPHSPGFVVVSSAMSGTTDGLARHGEVGVVILDALARRVQFRLPPVRKLTTAVKRMPEFERCVDRIWRLIADDVRETVLHENARGNGRG